MIMEETREQKIIQKLIPLFEKNFEKVELDIDEDNRTILSLIMFKPLPDNFLSGKVTKETIIPSYHFMILFDEIHITIKLLERYFTGSMRDMSGKYWPVLSTPFEFICQEDNEDFDKLLDLKQFIESKQQDKAQKDADILIDNFIKDNFTFQNPILKIIEMKYERDGNQDDDLGSSMQEPSLMTFGEEE